MRSSHRSIIFLVLTLAVLASAWIGRALASPDAPAVSPGLMSYQGFLTDENGFPYSGQADLVFGLYAASSGGSPLWTETYNNFTVSNGFFSLNLGGFNPLGAGVFGDPARYLQVSVDTGSGSVDLPRQRLTSVPYAFRADTADAAPWSGLTGVPAGFADGSDDGGTSYAQVKTVAKSGGDYTTIQAAIDSIGDASSSKRYQVWVAPGIYNEQVTMKSFVDLVGSGELTTEITFAGSASGTTGTVVMSGNAELRSLSVKSTGANTFAIAIYNNGAFSRIRNVSATASGATAHNYATYNNASSLTAAELSLTTTCTGGTNCYGMSNAVGSLVLSNSQINVVHGGNGFVYGISNSGISNAAFNDVQVTTTAGTGTNFGVLNNGASMTAQRSSFIAAGGSFAYGMSNTSGSSDTIKIDQSHLEGATSSLLNDTGFTTYIGSSRLFGGAVTGAGTEICAGVYDESYVFSASTCP